MPLSSATPNTGGVRARRRGGASARHGARGGGQQNTAPPAQRTLLDDLFAIYRQGCGTYCDFDPMDWPTFDGAAQVHYGPDDERYLQIGESANNYGVNH